MKRQQRRNAARKERRIFLRDNFWDKVGGAFTDPDKRFEFPIKPIETAFTKETNNALFLTAGIFAFGLIGAALIIKSKN
jgi:hypothetical protein